VCGIAGILRLRADAPPPDLDELRRVRDAMARRGPDGEGLWLSPGGEVALGHRRLAILGLSDEAAQPMRSADGRLTIVYNGEIYNFRELARGLEAEGATLRTASDTEVILELWRRRGADGLSALRGMYAFALWDGAERRLTLARDPYGIKPLYYAESGGSLRFASQVKALEAGGALDGAVDPAAVAGFLAWGSVPEPLTVRRAVRALPAGHVLTAGPELAPRLEAVPYRPEPAPAGAAGSFAEELERSVAAHLVADVPVAVFLSAGLDSSLVAALARRALPEPPVALTLTFAEARAAGRDEAPLAREVARRLGMRHEVREVEAGAVRERAAEILAAMDQPSIDGFNTYLIAELAREHGFKVALSGLGGDELAGGYPSFRDVPRWSRRARRLARLPGLAAAWPALARTLVPERPKLAGLLAHGGSLAGAYLLRRGLFLPEEVDVVGRRSDEPLGEAAPLAHLYDPALDAWERLDEGILGATSGLLRDPWRAVHRLESTIYLRNQLLRDADWAGMAHGVEIRVPLVDARLRAAAEAADFAPARAGGKRALVREAAPVLPAELFRRPRTGFHLPIADWLEPPEKGRERRVGDQSRRLALTVLEAFGVRIEDDAAA
jgi:asparagine synthase (glutamine-hydrolysing)